MVGEDGDMSLQIADEKILLVDDDLGVREAFQRNFRKIYIIETASCAREAAQVIARKGPFAVVVSDMRMPGMDGVQFLTSLKETAPDTVRIMLTGYAEVRSSVAAVNEGNVFRFLLKPCSMKQMHKTLEDALRQYRLVKAEKQLLEGTLSGSIKVLSELLALINPEAFGRSNRIHRLARQMALKLGLSGTWEMENAALLSQMGCIILPDEVVQKLSNGLPLSREEQRILETHPSIAADLLGHIPRMEGIAEMIAYQNKHFDGRGTPVDDKSGVDIPLGGRMLKILVDFDQLEIEGRTSGQVLNIMKGRKGWYDPALLDILEKVLIHEGSFILRQVNMDQLETNMILAEDVRTLKGMLLLAKGQEITPVVLSRLRTFSGIGGVREPIKVLLRLSDGRAGAEQ